jgi:hypothetical protein
MRCVYICKFCIANIRQTTPIAPNEFIDSRVEESCCHFCNHKSNESVILANSSQKNIERLQHLLEISDDDNKYY